MEVKLISLAGKVAGVRIGEKSYLIDRKYVQGSRIGDKIDIPAAALSTSTEYGIDWSLIIPDGITISPAEIQTVLSSRGIFILEDVKHNANGFADALASLMRKKSAELYRTVQEVIGGKE